MDTTIEERVKVYLDRVEALYADVERWVPPLSTEREPAEVVEQATGSYSAQRLLIRSAESEIARLEPIGAWIIAAEGRVDLIGSYDRTAILYLTRAGVTLKSQVSAGGQEIDRRTRLLFRGVDRDGWYWIEDSRRGRAGLITRELLMDLIAEVSDYEVQ